MATTTATPRVARRPSPSTRTSTARPALRTCRVARRATTSTSMPSTRPRTTRNNGLRPQGRRRSSAPRTSRRSPAIRTRRSRIRTSRPRRRSSRPSTTCSTSTSATTRRTATTRATTLTLDKLIVAHAQDIQGKPFANEIVCFSGAYETFGAAISGFFPADRTASPSRSPTARPSRSYNYGDGPNPLGSGFKCTQDRRQRQRRVRAPGQRRADRRRDRELHRRGPRASHRRGSGRRHRRRQPAALPGSCSRRWQRNDGPGQQRHRRADRR